MFPLMLTVGKSFLHPVSKHSDPANCPTQVKESYENYGFNTHDI